MKTIGKSVWLALVATLMLSASLLVACQAQATPTATVAPTATTAAKPTAAPTTAAATSSGASVEVSGLVGKVTTMTNADIKAKAVKISAEHPKKGMTEYSGVRLNDLLTTAQLKPEAKTLTLVAADGFKADVDVAKVKACADCMLAVSDDSPPDAVMPGMESSFWVKDVVKVEVK